MYTMHNRIDFEKQGTTEVVDIFLKEMLQAQVLEVQDIEYYRKQDVDVIAFKNGYKMKNLINAFIIYVFMMLMLLAVCFVIKLFGFTGVVFGVFGFSVLLAKIMVWR